MDWLGVVYDYCQYDGDLDMSITNDLNLIRNCLSSDTQHKAMDRIVSEHNKLVLQNEAMRMFIDRLQDQMQDINTFFDEQVEDVRQAIKDSEDNTECYRRKWDCSEPTDDKLVRGMLTDVAIKAKTVEIL